MLPLLAPFLKKSLRNGPLIFERSRRLLEVFEYILKSGGLASRARELFESSEVDEKRKLLSFVFQNLKLDGKTLLIDTYEPFNSYDEV